MKNFNGTVTLSLLDEDNTQRIIFRIIPLCTREGFIFQNRKANYPDHGSLRIIPDKREQSSFKERMRGMGQLCCVQLLTDGKEMTKIRQNRNYDPNQGECNQFAIYSDVVCGFENEAVFEVYQETDDFSHALTETVLIQRGKVLYGPVGKLDKPQWDELKPFGNENYLLHTVEGLDGDPRTYYWNPEALVTWRQRKKLMRKDVDAPTDTKAAADTEPKQPIVSQPSVIQPHVTAAAPKPEATQTQPASEMESIPIGIKLDLLDEQLTNSEHITGLNRPVSVDANLLSGDKPQPAEVFTAAPQYSANPIVKTQPGGSHGRHAEKTMHVVIDKQIKEHQMAPGNGNAERKPVHNPIDQLRAALQDVWHIPALHQEFFKVLGENPEIARSIAQSALMENQAQSAFSAAKTELDEIEGKRISLLVELDKVKANYEQTKEKMLAELTKKKQDEIAALTSHVLELKAERKLLEDELSRTGDQIKTATMEYLAAKATTIVTSNGTDITVSPTIGYHFETADIVEDIRLSMSGLGFICKQDCVTEFLSLFSLHDEIYLFGNSLWEAEYYIQNVLQTMGLTNVTAWPGASGILRVVSFLPENDLRTPTVEIIKNDRTPVRAYGHKVIRLIDMCKLKEIDGVPVFRVPNFNKTRGQEDRNEYGRPVSLRALHAFSNKADLLHPDGEAWFEKLGTALEAEGLQVQSEVIHAMRVYARVTAPQLIGGFMEAADIAALAWIVPAVLRQNVSREKLLELCADLPRCKNVVLQAEVC